MLYFSDSAYYIFGTCMCMNGDNVNLDPSLNFFFIYPFINIGYVKFFTFFNTEVE